MALEIKSIDVDNESEENIITVFLSFGWKLKNSQRIFNQTTTPRGVISYQNLHYVHSETNTIDFTKLVFERDKNMPNYDELVELEDKFWDLTNKCPEPVSVPELMKYEEWVRKNKPTTFSKSADLLVSFIFYVISAFLFAVLIYFVGAKTGEIETTFSSFITAFGICMIIVPMNLFLGGKLFTVYNYYRLKTIDIHKNTALKSYYSDYVARITALQETAATYDSTIKTIRSLLWQAQQLL